MIRIHTPISVTILFEALSMKTILPVLAFTAFFAGCQMAEAPAEEAQDPVEPTTTDASFDAIKSLEGTWNGTMAFDDGREDVTILSEFKVVSGGNTVIEKWIEDGVEMATTFTMEDGRMLTKHYCVLGTEPSFQSTMSTDGTLDFTLRDDVSYETGVNDFLASMSFDLSEVESNSMSRSGVVSVGGEDITSSAVLTRTTDE